MKILYLSFYFEPDLCAGSFRNSPLAKEVGGKLAENGSVDVLTTVPNRYSSYQEDAPLFEERGNIAITRIPIPSHKSGFIDQVFSFRSYYNQVLKVVKKRQYDLVFASSSRLFTAYLGYKVAKSKDLPLYLDIRDIFTENMSEILNLKLLKFVMIPWLERIEKKTFDYANHINLVSPGFKGYFEKFKCENYSYFTNGIDPEFVEASFERIKQEPKITITYAGNIGTGQGLDHIVPEAAKILGTKYQFRIIGDGGAKAKLSAAVENQGLENVEILKPLERSKLIEVYRASDFLFLHLNSYKAFEKVLPSKIFEYGATGKPIVAGVKGQAASFLRDHLPDSIIFDPGDVKEMVSNIKSFTGAENSRDRFKFQYARKAIVDQMAQSIIRTG